MRGEALKCLVCRYARRGWNYKKPSMNGGRNEWLAPAKNGGLARVKRLAKKYLLRLRPTRSRVLRCDQRYPKRRDAKSTLTRGKVSWLRLTAVDNGAALGDVA